MDLTLKGLLASTSLPRRFLEALAGMSSPTRLLVQGCDRGCVAEWRGARRGLLNELGVIVVLPSLRRAFKVSLGWRNRRILGVNCMLLWSHAVVLSPPSETSLED